MKIRFLCLLLQRFTVNLVMKSRIWFNRGAPPEKAWVIQEESGQERLAASVVVVGRATFIAGPEGSCPKGWVEAEGLVVLC